MTGRPGRRRPAGSSLPALPVLAALAGLLWLPPTATAWGPNGHRVVARIAESHMNPEATRAIDALIGPESLVRGATWADEIRSDPAWNHAAPWHYINIEPGDSVETAERSERGDVLAALERFEALLRDPSAEPGKRAEALKFLTHFVGDVHQPLHAGRAQDRGGNEILVLWFDEPSNLHRVWDTELIEHQDLSFSEMADLIDHATPDQVSAWQADGYRDWIDESKALLDAVYDLGDRRLGWGYAYRNTPIVERRLLQAGIRLAGLLDSIFATSDSDH